MSSIKKNLIGAPKRPGRNAPATRPGQLPTDFIALGSKPKDGRNHGNDSSRMPPLKKPKIQSSSVSVLPHLRFSATAESITSRMSPTIPDPTVLCIDCLPEDIVHQVLKYMDSKQDQAEGILCGAIRNLRINRLKPDTTIVLSLLYLAKIHPDIFNSECIIESLCCVLKKDIGVDYIKSKTNNIVAIIACNILMKVLEKENNWPTLIVQVFLDDSLGERIWVDHIDCLPFVKNIQTAFGTRVSQHTDKDDVTDIMSKEMMLSRFDSKLETVQNLANDILKERLSRRQTDIGINPVSQSQAASSAALTGKYLIQTLTSTSGLQDIRTAATAKMDMWLQNPKLIKSAQDLLHAVCVNCNTHSQEDVDVIGNLTKLRMKSKLHLNHYLSCIKELIDAHPDNLKTMLSYVLYNELSNARNQSNMSVVVSTLQTYPELASKTLASVFQDLLLQQEDYLRAVRSLLREIIRSVKHEIQFTSLALGLMQEPDMEKYQLLDQNHKDRFIQSTADLICLTMLLSITPQTKEAMHVISGKKKASDSIVTNPETIYRNFKRVISEVQHDSLWWVHAIVIPRLTTSLSANDYMQLLHKLTFLRSPDTYHTRDNWPPETERAFLVKACQEVPVLEDALLRIAAIGLSQDHPLTPVDALELIGQLVRRAGAISRPDLNPITAERTDFIETILALCQYHHPGNIRLPAAYIPPSLAISHLYWSALQTLLIVVSLNPLTIGRQAWSSFPMLKVLMEMSIVNRFSYPPITLVDESLKNQMIGKEHQMALVEKTEILEFESHLAAATTGLVVTEESSLLLSQLMAMDPQGHPRRPPDRFLDQLGNLSSRLQLGVLLCRSRDPDFLLEIINRHGENQSMTWLPDLISLTKGDVGLLPVQCLCEFLLVRESEWEKLSSGGIHPNELVGQLRKLLNGENLDEALQVAQYFLKRLCSPQKVIRERARKALTLVVSNPPKEFPEQTYNDDFAWLLCDLFQTSHYASVIRAHAIEAVRSAALIESQPLCVIAYVRFLANDLRHFQALSTPAELLTTSTNYARMVSHVLIDRRIIVDSVLSLATQKLLPSDQVSAAEIFIASLLEIFLVHLRHAQDHDMRRRMDSSDENNDGVPWSDSQDEVYVKWPDNSAATIHILIPQASTILLGFGPPSAIAMRSNGNDFITDVENDNLYTKLLNVWFSDEGYVIPQAFLMDTQEEALLIPDWLRLRMLRSAVLPITRRMAFAAVRDLDVEQIILFVQSFGIPVESMNLLLEILDSQCDTNSGVILNATRSNANYMARLLDVQKMRGCKAGTKVAELLQGFADKPTQKAAPSCVIDLRDDSSDSAMESGVVNTTAVHKIPQDVAHMRPLLLQLFSTNGGTASRWSLLLQSVNQACNPTAQICVESLHSLIFTDLSIDFVSFLYNSPSRSCCLLRALDRVISSPKRNVNAKTKQYLQEIMDKIQRSGKLVMEKLGTKSRSLYSLVKSWQSRSALTNKGIRARRASSTSEQSDNLRHSDWSRLEEFLRHQLAFLDKDEEIKAKVGLVAQILLEEISHRRTQMSLGKLDYNEVCFTSIGTTGLLVDWLQLLDPELLAHTPILQRKLLFESGRNDFSDFTTPVFDQAYLLSLLAEHCNWETIHSSLRWLLSDFTPDPTVENLSAQSSINVDPKTALDFLWVVIQAPKIWQGRENKNSSVKEPVLQLTTTQFTRLLAYVVAATANQKVNSTNESTSDQGVNYIDLFSLYFSKFGQTLAGLKRITDIALYLRNKINTSPRYSPYTAIWWQLLAKLYVLQPNAGVWDDILKPSGKENDFCPSDVEKFSDSVTSISIGTDCHTDALVSSLLNRLGYVRSRSVNARVGSSMMTSNLDSAYDANLILNKMASSRPFLILRQLSILSSMLRGRTRHEFKEFKAQHHLPLMLNSVGILQQLSPLIFRELHAKHLYEMVEAFWQVLRNHCERARRQMLPMLHKTLYFTHNYLCKSPNDATKILSQQQSTLQMLIRTYGDQEIVMSMVHGFQSSIFSWSGKSDTGERPATSVRTPVLSQPWSTGVNREKGIPIVMEMLGDDQDLENIFQILGEFDETSKRRIENVTPYVGHLSRIFSRSRDPNARVLALAAALRHARNQPECTRTSIYPRYIARIRELSKDLTEDEDKNRSESADSLPLTSFNLPCDAISRSLLTDASFAARDFLQFLPDVVILCREKALPLLGAAFDTGAKCGSPYSYNKPVSGDASANRNENADVTNLLARSLWLLRGLDECDLKPKS